MPYIMNFLRRVFKCRLRERGVITAETESKNLVVRAMRAAFQEFRSPKFRALAELEKLPREEQDRIFNELLVTAIVFLYLTLDDSILLLAPEHKPFWFDVRDTFSGAYARQLESIGICGETLELWKKVLNMRLEEFKEGMQDVEELLREEHRESAGRERDLAFRRVMTAAIALLLHITRREATPDHPLKKRLTYWLIALHNHVAPEIGW